MKKKPSFFTGAIGLGDLISATPTIRKLSEVYEQPVRVFSFEPELFSNLPYVSSTENITEWRQDPNREKWLRKTYDLHSTYFKMGKKVQLSDERGIEIRHPQIDSRQYHAIDLGFNLIPDDMHCDYVPTEDLMVELPEKYVCFHASKTWSSRSWKKESWAYLAGRLIQKGINVVLIGKDGMSDEDIANIYKTSGGYVEKRLVEELQQKTLEKIDQRGIIDLTNKTNLSQLWHVIDRAQCLVTMDSGVLHMAGTTDTYIIQLGSSIHPKFRAPYRYGSQDYRYFYSPGTCDLFCGSNMKYSIRDWQKNYNGGTPLQSLTLVDTCLERKPTFECHPKPDDVERKILEVIETEWPITEKEIKRKAELRVLKEAVEVPAYSPDDLEEFEVKFRAVYEDSSPKLEVVGSQRDPRFFEVCFMDKDSKEIHHKSTIKAGYWARPMPKTDIAWMITVSYEGEVLFESSQPDRFDTTSGQIHASSKLRILVKFLTGALGDTIAGMPAVLTYQRKESCDIYVECKWAHILKNSYPTINFIENADEGQFDKVHRVDYHFEHSVQEGIARDLNFTTWTYRRPLVDYKPQERPIKGKYVVIGMQSTAQCKYWNYPNGWNILCKMLRKEGLTPICVDQYESFGIKGNFNLVPTTAVRRLDNKIQETINYIYHAEFFVGISSGLAWIAHALGKKVVMISGITEPWNEFSEDCLRIINQEVCHGCFHKVEKYKFDSGDWMWCGEHKNTNRQFECTKTITPESVMNKIKSTGWIPQTTNK